MVWPEEGATMAKSERDDARADDRNEVRLQGRLSGEAEERVLPSGNVLVNFRLTVGRPPDSGPSRVTVDTIDCVVRPAALRRTVGAWKVGDVVELEGMLSRRFWRGAAGLASRYEVEVTSARRLARAA
jgi:single-strand DNA-binding protein